MELKDLTQRIKRIFIELFMKYTRNSFQKKTRNTPKEQSRILQKILKTNEGTQFQIDFKLSPQMSVADFRKKMPLTNYDMYRPYVDRMMRKNSPHELTNERIVYFSLTTGTSNGQPKVIPHSALSLEMITRAYMPAFAELILMSQKKELGKGIYFISVLEDGLTEFGIRYGTASVAGQYLYGKKLKQDSTRVLPNDCARVTGEKLEYLNWLFALGQEDMSYICGLFPLTIIAAYKLLQDRAEMLLNDLEHGTLTKDIDFPEDVRASVNRYHKPKAERAQKIRAMLREKGRLEIRDLWPQMEYILCAKGGNCRYYVEQLPKYFKGLKVYGPGINGSEGVYGLGMDTGYEFVAALTGSFLEFIPYSKVLEPNPETLLMHELKVGEQYEVVLTVINGFYRYKMGDIIRVTGMINKAPKFEFLFRHGGKSGGVISASFEKVNEEEVRMVFLNVIRELGINVDVFIVGPDRKNVFPRYRIVVEGNFSEDKILMERVSKLFDDGLRKMNLLYDRLRKAEEIHAPYAFDVPEKTIREYFMSRSRETAKYQVKIPQVSEDSQFWSYIEEVQPSWASAGSNSPAMDHISSFN